MSNRNITQKEFDKEYLGIFRRQISPEEENFFEHISKKRDEYGSTSLVRSWHRLEDFIVKHREKLKLDDLKDLFILYYEIEKTLQKRNNRSRGNYFPKGW